MNKEQKCFTVITIQWSCLHDGISFEYSISNVDLCTLLLKDQFIPMNDDNTHCALFETHI